MKTCNNYSSILMFGILLTVFLVSCSNNTKKAYWKSGKLQSEVHYKNGIMDGDAIWYFENGNIQQKLTYQDGKINGEVKRFYDNGNLESVSHYKMGLLDGAALTFDTEGNKIGEENFINDTLDGTVSKYYSDGEPQMTGSYYKGLFQGRWVYYDVYGNIVGSANYDKGNGVLKGWWPNGKLKREINYKNNLKHGPEKHFDAEGKLEKLLIYNDGVLVQAGN